MIDFDELNRSRVQAQYEISDDVAKIVICVPRTTAHPYHNRNVGPRLQNLFKSYIAIASNRNNPVRHLFHAVYSVTTQTLVHNNPISNKIAFFRSMDGKRASATTLHTFTDRIFHTIH